jgi:phosphosulfolactate synthase
MERPTFLDLEPRPGKPRSIGLTAAIDGGLPVDEVRAIVHAHADVFDLWKLGWGSAYLDPQLDLKLDLLRRADIAACTGGTLLEIAALQDRAAECIDWAAGCGFPFVEVSDGLDLLGPDRKGDLIALAARQVRVIAEVGTKDPARTLTAAEWVSLARRDLDAGATWVVAEGRESGTVGIYDRDGSVRADIVEALLDHVGAEHLLFEAPRKEQQAWFINHVGAEVNLSNVAPREAMGVEALRVGLRADTTASALLRRITLRS